MVLKPKKKCLSQEEFRSLTSKKWIILSICTDFSSFENQNNSNHTFLECLLAANPWNNHFTCIILFNSHSYPIRLLLLSPFYRWSNWSWGIKSKKLINGRTVTKSKHSQFRVQLLCRNVKSPAGTACQHCLGAPVVREELLHGVIPRLRMEKITCCRIEDLGTRHTVLGLVSLLCYLLHLSAL